MSNMPVHLFEGLVFERPEGFFCQTLQGEVCLSEALHENQGRVVAISLHHLPPEPPLAVPGFGCCMWGDFCPQGHPSRPDWLFQQHLQGVLTSRDGKWYVGGVLMELRSLLGHRSRVLVVRELPDSPEGGLQDLQDSAEQLGEILSALKAHMRNEDG